MNHKELAFISFQRDLGKYVAYVPVQQFLSHEGDAEAEMKKASVVYEHAVLRMQSVLSEIADYRHRRVVLPATKMWELGDNIFKLVEDLKALSFQIDGIYEHLVRDLNVKRKWLEKVIIFRRHIPDEHLIPRSLGWGVCEKGTRRKAERISQGLPPVV